MSISTTDLIHLPAGSELLYSSEMIHAQCAIQADELIRRYRGQRILLITTLYGAMPYSVALQQALADHPDGHLLTFDQEIVHIDRTGNSTEFREPVIVRDLLTVLHGRHILIIEDLIDAGKTLELLAATWLPRQPASLSISALIQCDRRSNGSEPRKVANLSLPMVTTPFVYRGQQWLFGFGPDYCGQYRNLPAVYIAPPPA